MDIKFNDFEDNDRGRQINEQLEKTLKERTLEGLAFLAKFEQATIEIEQLRNDNNRLACLAIDNAKDTGRALMYRKILQQIADEGSGHGQALAYAALKEKE
jgi:hypothetical protein